MKVGYVRVSTEEQNTARQEVIMQELGVEKVFIEKVSGKTQRGREELEKMLQYVREGDAVVVESISRIARNTKDLLGIVDRLNEKGVDFTSRKEDIDTNTPSGKFMLTVFGAIAQLEREYILDRQREGIEIARQNGKYLGRKPIVIDEEKFKEVYARWKSGEIQGVSAMRELGLKPSTFYRRVRDYEAKIISSNTEMLVRYEDKK
ncbi:MAG: recombinase family protein [Lachnospiraceae bacterium]|nr:recombinase family protein [Lachnospiraceae bacterium]